jgi:hypothetical protein
VQEQDQQQKEEKEEDHQQEEERTSSYEFTDIDTECYESTDIDTALHRGENADSKKESDVVLLKLSDNKSPSLEMTKEQYNAWKGHEKKNEEYEDEENH